MNENLEPNETERDSEKKKQPEIIVNDYGASKDGAVVIEEENRTVLLTEDETIIIEKDSTIDIAPKNRPRKVYAGMWGSLEIATVGLGMLAILAVIILVVLVVLPARKELENNRAERARLDAELMSARSKYGSITTTEARVAELIESANAFESRYLRNPAIGKTDLYQRINGLINAYNLTNTSGPDYAPLLISDGQRGGGGETETDRGRAKFQSIFPGVYVTTTVEGSYQNLRRFIREIETSNQFVVISAIELQPSDTEQKGGAAQPTQASINNVEISPMAPNGVPLNTGFPAGDATVTTQIQPKANRGKTRGETVSLRLEMAAYFSRPNAAPAANVEVTAQ